MNERRGNVAVLSAVALARPIGASAGSRAFVAHARDGKPWPRPQDCLHAQGRGNLEPATEHCQAL